MQLVTDLVRDSARRAGFTPCLGIDHLVTVDQRGQQKGLVAIEVGRSEEPLLRINRMNEHFDTVLQIISSTRLITTSIQPLHRQQSILIADCYHAEAQKISRVKHTAAGQIITLSNALAFNYHAPIYLGEWLEEIYFTRSHLHKESSLFYYLQHAEELTTAVHTLSVNADKHQGRTLLRVIFGLDNAGKLELETMVRAA